MKVYWHDLGDLCDLYLEKKISWSWFIWFHEFFWPLHYELQQNPTPSFLPKETKHVWFNLLLSAGILAQYKTYHVEIKNNIYIFEAICRVILEILLDILVSAWNSKITLQNPSKLKILFIRSRVVSLILSQNTYWKQ